MFTQEQIDQHHKELAEFYDKNHSSRKWASLCYCKTIATYYRHYIPSDSSVLEIGCGNGMLLAELPNKNVAGIDVSEKQIERSRERVPHGKFTVMAGESIDLEETYDFIILSDTLNLVYDAQKIFELIHSVSHSDTRLIINIHNNLWKPILNIAEGGGIKSKSPQLNWFTVEDIDNLLELSGWQIIKKQTKILMPIKIPLISNFLNRFVAPFLHFFCLSNFIIARSLKKAKANDCKVSVIIPARNEAGNIENAIKRLPKIGTDTEIIFIEGNSSDNTWEEIQRIQKEYNDHDIKIMQQSGKGKGNAVREAFDAAAGGIFMILDADLTVAPEDLPKFYEPIRQGQAEFVNGVRLVYPMGDVAMRFFNLCANKAFSMLFSVVLDQPIKDTLCGTKVLTRESYNKIAANRAYFGDFDPFGDFDLIFGAAKLNLKIVDIPIRYANRTYGTTNIDRWSAGVMLLRMLCYGALRLKLI